MGNHDPEAQMCSHDHTTMMRLKLGPWRDTTRGGVLLTDLSRRDDLRSPANHPAPRLFSTIFRTITALKNFKTGKV